MSESTKSEVFGVLSFLAGMQLAQALIAVFFKQWGFAALFFVVCVLLVVTGTQPAEGRDV